REEEQAEALLTEFRQVREAGLELAYEPVDGDTVQELAPVVTDNVARGVRIDEQRFVDPGSFVEALGEAVRRRGGTIQEGAEVRGLRHGPGGVHVDVVGGTPVLADAVVLATGAWLPQLARRYGVRVPLRAGRGYSFSVPNPTLGDGQPAVRGPVYFPHERVICTPIGDRGCRGGTMEILPADASLYPYLIDARVYSSRTLVR